MTASAASERVIGAVRGDAPGPTLLLVGSIHGNEPAGAEAARRTIERVRSNAVPIAGEVVALIGNRAALAARRRYLDRDLNRLWIDGALAEARAAVITGEGVDAEAVELVELALEIERATVRARGPVFVIDLHTTSADGIPFAVVGPSPAHRAFALQFPLPGIVGLEEQLEGVLTRYLGERGFVTMAVEGGQSQSAAALTNLEAVATMALSAAGLVAADQLPGWQESADYLAQVRGDLPQLTQVVTRHAISPDHGFQMEPGFANIQRIDGGTLLARDCTGEIHAPFDGLVLLPLYQPQGSDGFFYGRELAPGG